MCVRMPSNPRSIAGVPSSRALVGFPITAPPPFFFSSCIFALAVWRQNQKKKNVTVTLLHHKCKGNKKDAQRPVIMFES